jgi:hypothetical protein
MPQIFRIGSYSVYLLENYFVYVNLQPLTSLSSMSSHLAGSGVAIPRMAWFVDCRIASSSSR